MFTGTRRYTPSTRRTFRTTRHAFEATRAYTPRTGRYTPGHAAQTPGNVAQVPRTWRRFHGHDAGSADVTQVLRMLTGTRERAGAAAIPSRLTRLPSRPSQSGP